MNLASQIKRAEELARFRAERHASQWARRDEFPSLPKDRGRFGDPGSAIPNLQALDLADFLKRKFPPREYVLSPILPRQGLAMIYARTGVGKTLLALTATYAAACGAPMFRGVTADAPNWHAPKPVRAIYVDAELPGAVLQERLARIVKGFGPAIEPAPGCFRVFNPDLDGVPVPDIGMREGQDAFESLFGDAQLIVLDNLSALARVGDELDSRDWAPVQDWLLSQRRQGRSVLLVHHAGKGGDQRGTSRREDVLDTVIRLVRPDGYSPEDGACFEVSFAKARHLYGKNAAPFEATLKVVDGAATWDVRPKTDPELDAVRDLTAEGKSVREVAAETGLSKSAVSRLQQKLKREAG